MDLQDQLEYLTIQKKQEDSLKLRNPPNHHPTLMEISKAHKVVLFKKEDCVPCENAAKSLDSVLDAYQEYEPYVSVLNKDNHPSLLETYKIDIFPTALVMDHDSVEITRVIGGKNLSPKWWQRALRTIHMHRTNP